jgi:signal transduction histidine kinase
MAAAIFPVLANAIVRSSEWALRIIRDLLDVTAIEAGRLTIHPEPMIVQAITEAICSMFASSAATAGVTLVVEPVGTALWVDADVDRVIQAVGNLVGNAIKFTPRGGKVTLAVSRDDHSVRFRVEDTGVGIAPENIPHLFDRFWQAHESGRGGAGLGLVIAHGIAEGSWWAHRGRKPAGPRQCVYPRPAGTAVKSVCAARRNRGGATPRSCTVPQSRQRF